MYAPLVEWMSDTIMLTLAGIENLHTKSIDFVLTYPQAELHMNIYMELPQGFNVGTQAEDMF